MGVAGARGKRLGVAGGGGDWGEGVKFYIWSGDGILYIGKSLAHQTFLESSRVGDFFYIPRHEPSPLP